MGLVYKNSVLYGGGGSSIQVDTMETASADNVGEVVQYIGTTTATYTTNYFYKCVEDNGTYSWVNVDVQAGGVSLTQAEYDLLPEEEKNNGTTYYITDATTLSLTNAKYGFTPVGTIISVMGNFAPVNYLACQGQEVAIDTYPELAQYFKDQFGESNHFGGDGITTFALPDLRGEFLRGASDYYGVPGIHVDATEIPLFNTGYNTSGGTKDTISLYHSSDVVTGDYDSPRNMDKTLQGTSYAKFCTVNSDGKGTSAAKTYAFTTHPDYTSVLYCIAYRNIYITHQHIDERDKYSTTEKIVGEWIDGKPIYQKTFTGITLGTPSSVGTSADVSVNIGANVDTVVYSHGEFLYNGAYTALMLLHEGSNNAKAVVRFFVLNNNHASTPNTILVRNCVPSYGGCPVHVTIQYTKTV